MSLTAGSKLGPYEIVSPLGAGGMGEVYRARDTRLERTVAIKILPAEVAKDAVRKQRFEREAKTISSLNHPHICTLHDIGSQDGVDYLVMECVEGETLAKRLEKGPLPLEQVLKYGAQTADALDKAHRAGIVHRDLKPGNIMLTPAGAKLLDFGLAKPASPMTSLATLSGTKAESPVTEQGTIVGTFQYMSPEQVEGKELDGRSDIFSLGAVLYEMVTGQRAFPGRSQLTVASAILEKEPAPISTVKPLTPPALDHAIKKCIAKSTEERWQSASDLASELKWIAETGVEGATHGVAARPGKLRLVVWASTTMVAIALAIVTTYYTTRPSPESPLLASVIPPPGVFADTSGRNGPPQISPNGERLAFIGCKTESASSSNLGSKFCSIWVRSLDSTDAHEIAGTSGGYSPFWSTDGREIAFFADGKLKRVAADGGPVQVICDAADARGGSWGRSGTIVFAPTRSGAIFRVPAEGGTPVAITGSTPASIMAHRWPNFLPDGEHFFYEDTTGTGGSCWDLNELHFASLNGKQDVSLMRTCSNASFAAGHLIYWRDGNLVAQPFDAGRGVLSGAAVAIVEHVGFDSLFSFGEFSASANGRLVYVAGEGLNSGQLVWYDRAGKILGTFAENDQYKNVAFAPDNSRVAVNAIHEKKSEVWVLDARGTRTRLTPGGGDYDFPTWSADGRQIYFTSNANGPYDIFVKPADSSSEEQKVVTFEKGQFGAAFLAASLDGKYLAYVASDPTGNLGIYTVPLTGDRRPHLFIHPAANASAPAFSRDGKWLAYESNQSGRNEVYITPFPGGGAQYQVSTSGGERPVWRHDGKEIFYRATLTVMAVEVNTKERMIELSPPKALFEMAVRNLNGRWYDVSRDGRFLANTSPKLTQDQNFGLVVNWPAKLKK